MARILYIGCVYLFALPKCFGVYTLSGSPEHVVLGDNVTVTLRCVADDEQGIVKWTRNDMSVAHIERPCESINASNTYNYNYTCDPVNKTYYLIIPPDAITDGIHNVVWRCLPSSGEGSNGWNLTLSVPVTTVTITPAGDNNSVSVIKGETQTFTCNTDSIRPAASIQWYIGGQNVTNQTTPQTSQQDGDKFISSSCLVYTGRDVDHNKTIFCEAVNIEGRLKVKSTERSLYIKLSVTTVTITPAGDNNSVSVIEGETQTFTCTTDSSRPAALIQWYIGGQNVTNQATPQQDGDKFISSSSLVYTARYVDHNKVIFCDAVNFEGRHKVESGEKSLYIQQVLDDTDTPSALIGGVVGSVSGILIIILIVVVVFFIRRHNNKGDDQEPIERNVPHEDDEDDGLKDNPCYITSPGSSNVDCSAHNNGQGYSYSQVDRTNKTDGLKDNPFCITSPGSSNVDSSAHNNGQGYIYSQVDRTNKTGNKEGKGKNLAKTGKMEQNHKDIELDVYENPDEVLNDIQAESVYAKSDTNNKMTGNDQNKKQKKNK